MKRYKDSTLIELLNSFNATIKVNDMLSVSKENAIMAEAFKLGYIVPREACNYVVNYFITSKNVDYNSTFYKTYSDIISKTRFELFIDQVLHYMSTYGTNFAFDNGYTQNDRSEYKEIFADVDFTKFKVIKLYTEKEMFEKCFNMLKSGIALKKESLEAYIDFICTYAENNNVEIDIDSINNREAIAIICDTLNILPKDKFNLFRYIIYSVTGNATIIKDKNTINKIKAYSNLFDFTNLNDEHLKALSSIFYRFKPLFLAFKTNRYNSYCINKIRRYAKKYHTPMKNVMENSLFSNFYTNEQIREFAKTLNNFKLIKLINAALYRLNNTDCDLEIYSIRNGSIYYKESKEYTYKSYYNNIYIVLYVELINRMKNKATYVKVNNDVDLACPTSEKNFIGNIPIYSSINIGQNSIIGIYWRNEWGANDFDLAAIDFNTNTKVGWNSAYNKSGIIYSGDMTNANPEAAETLYISDKIDRNYMIMCSMYYGRYNSKYNFFYAKEKVDMLKANYMVNPANIILSTDIVMSNKTTQILGFINDSKMYFSTFDFNNNRVSSVSSGKIINNLIAKSNNSIKINDILKKSGFIFVDENTEIPEGTEVIDLTNPTKDTIIELFS